MNPYTRKASVFWLGTRQRGQGAISTATMEDFAAGWAMTQIHHNVIAIAPKVAHCDFLDAALRAKANCPISRSLNANTSIRAQLNHRS